MPAEGGCRFDIQPMLQHGCVNTAKIDRHFDVAILTVGQAGRVGMQAGVDLSARKKNRTGRAVVGPLRCVLLHTPAKLAETEHCDAIIQFGDS